MLCSSDTILTVIILNDVIQRCGVTISYYALLYPSTFSHAVDKSTGSVYTIVQ